MIRTCLTALATAAAVLAAPAYAYDGEQYVVCNLDPNGDNFLALRTCGSSKCEMLRTLAPGTFLMATEPSATKGWRHVILQRDIQDWNYDGVSGWVYHKYICRIEYP